MKIIIKAKSVYGNVLYYVQGDAALYIGELTGKKTVTLKQIEALKQLGLNVEVYGLPME